MFSKDNWNVPTSVYVLGVFDDVIDGDIAYNVTFDMIQPTLAYRDPAFKSGFFFPSATFGLTNKDSKYTYESRNRLLISHAEDSPRSKT